MTRWVEPTTGETANVKKLRTLIDELYEQGVPALDGIAARIETCITVGDRRGYPLIEPPPRRLWGLLTVDNPNYLRYRKRTTRVLPIVRLCPA